MREFKDEQGVRWAVYAVHREGLAEAAVDTGRRYLPTAYRGGWLVFESDARKLRLAPIPDGWDDLPDGALRTLILSAVPATPTTPRGQRAYGAPPSDDDAGGDPRP